MTIHALEIPEATADLAEWLEQQLVSLHLAELVTELAAVHGSLGRRTNIEGLLGGQRSDVLESGLQSLSRRQLRTLCGEPRLLVDLQDLVLTAGGPYWLNRVAENGEIARFAIGQRSSALAPMHHTVSPQAELPAKVAWYQHPAVVSLATAAALLLAFVLYPRPTRPAPEATAWGWNRTDLPSTDVTREQYLVGLADAAEEWFKKQPSEATDLAARIGQFRNGCTRLILAEHKPLPEADRTWLVEKCRAWAVKIDEHRAQLESGGSVDQARAGMDETVRKLATAIRERSRLGAI